MLICTTADRREVTPTRARRCLDVVQSALYNPAMQDADSGRRLRVLLVEDSIVRATTLKVLLQRMKLLLPNRPKIIEHVVAKIGLGLQ